MATTTTQTRRPVRSQADWDVLARDVIVPRLADGESMTAIRAEFGSGATIRRALMRVGFDTKGQPTQVGKVAASKPQVLAKRVADRRAAGASWDRLALGLGRAAANCARCWPRMATPTLPLAAWCTASAASARRRSVPRPLRSL